jgi:hypothetical protein
MMGADDVERRDAAGSRQERPVHLLSDGPLFHISVLLALPRLPPHRQSRLLSGAAPASIPSVCGLVC